MATALYERSAVFRDAFDEVDAAMAPHLGARIREVMNDEGINRTEFAQPAIFALQYAQAQALLRLGAEPAWLLGHSIGEYAAAAIAEVFSLDDACRLVVARGRLMQQLPAGGGMLAVRASAGRGDRLSPRSRRGERPSRSRAVWCNGSDRRRRTHPGTSGDHRPSAQRVARVPLAAHGTDDGRVRLGGRGVLLRTARVPDLLHTAWPAARR